MKHSKQIIGVTLVILAWIMLKCLPQTITYVVTELVIWLSGAIFVMVGMYKENSNTATNVLSPWKFYHDYYWGISVSLLASGFTVLVITPENGQKAWFIITAGAVFLATGAYYRGKLDRFSDTVDENISLRKRKSKK